MWQILITRPQDSAHLAGRLSNISAMLGRRFERTESMGDLNSAVNVADMAVNATPQDHPDRAAILNNFGIWLGARFEWTRSMDDLNRAVDVADMAVNATPQGHPDRASRLSNLGNLLGTRFRQTGSIDDLNHAVEVADIAVNAIPQDHPDRAAILNNLGNWLGAQFEQIGLIDNLNRAVDVIDMAVNTAPQDYPNRAEYLNNLGMWLGIRFEQTGLLEDLNYAINVAGMAVNATPQDHPNRPGYLSNLGNLLGMRFEWTGSMDDLNRAVDVADMAVNATPQDHPYRATRLNNLGNLLGTRFDRTGLMDDLNHAVGVAIMAVSATHKDHPDQAGRLNNLGNRLGRRFERTGSIDDLNLAVNVADIAVNATPQDHPDRAGYLNNLGNWLSARFEQTELMDDLNRAFDVADMAVNATPQDHPDRAGYLNNLGNRLSTRFERTGLIDDLNRAIEVTDIAANATPQCHPDRAGRLNDLGKLLSTRFKRTSAIKDFDKSLGSYRAGWRCENASPSIRISLARRAAILLASQRNWEESSTFLQSAVKLLPLVSPRLLKNNDKQHILRQFAGLSSMATAISLNAGNDEYQALKLLELGRCIIAGLLVEMRTDISDLKEQYPRLVEEFESLRDELDSSPSKTPLLGDTASSWESQINRRLKADQRFNEVITKIRDLPGFGNFLLPPTRKELMTAACQGPIAIINISSYRCDAFIVEDCQIRMVPLPGLSEEELHKRIQQLSVGSAPTLQWLWSAIAGPILDALGYQYPPPDDNWPHIWWIPTGALSHFPVHAAGYHTQGSTTTVLDRVISSYALSVKTLVYGRKYTIHTLAESASEHALLVAMQDTPGKSALPFASREVKMLKDLCQSLQLTPVIPPRRRSAILEQLRACQIFHFAGHGRSHPLDPSRSCLLLDDWKESPLTIEYLRDSKVRESSPFLGYLSACSTGANKVDELVDEGIHLVSAFQLAGFRHVIGTLWEVDDSCCVDVARVVYETIRDEGMTDMAICRGLHRAVRALRDGRIEKTRMTDESYTTRASRRNLEVPGVAEANNVGVETVREVVNDNVRMHACGSETVAQDKPTYKETEDMSSSNVACGNERCMMQPGRDAELCEESHEAELHNPQYWAPYIHFGV